MAVSQSALPVTDMGAEPPAPVVLELLGAPENQAEAETEAEGLDEARANILIVDDRPENLLALEAVLDSLDCRLVRADSGQEALKHLMREEFAAILLDVQMPGMDGFETATIIKEREKTRSIPIIFVTAINKEEKHVFQGYETGAVDYIVKPFDPTILKSKVAVFIELWQKTEQIKRQAETIRQNEQREAAHQLAESAAQLDRFKPPLEATLDGLFIFESDTLRFSYLNPGALDRLGYEEGEAMCLSILDLLPGFDEARLETILKPLRDGTQSSRVLELMLLCKSGQEIPLELYLQFIGPLSNGRFVVTMRDITERKRAAQQIQQQLERIMALHNIDMAITASSDLRVTLNVILDQVAAMLGVDGAVLLLNSHTQMLEYAAGHGFHTSALKHTQLRMGQGYAGRAALERRVLTVSNLETTPGDLAASPLLASEHFVTYYAVPLIAKGQVKGVLEVFQREEGEADAEWLNFLEILSGQAAIAIDNATLFDELQRSNVELVLAYDTTLEGWSRALDLRDKETEGHTLRVTETTLRLARLMGLSDEELVHIRRGALLHDIGKMGIPDSILLKPGPLSDEEWVIMRKHPVYAFELLAPVAFLRPALDIPHFHHEKWDGSGYPNGLKADQIPLCARIFAIIDVWDALLSNRPYRQGWPMEKVKQHLSEGKGTHFDPRVVEAFMALDA